MPPRDYYVYIMTGRSGIFYTGITNDLEYRLAQHRAGLSEYTAKYHLDRLVYFEATSDIRDAISREKQIKSRGRARKIALIKTLNPRFLDLANGVPDPVLRPTPSRYGR